MGSMKHQISFYTAALTATQSDGSVGAAPSEIQLFPAGQFRADDGRPANVAGWVMTQKQASALIAMQAARKNPTVIDFEHQTLNAKHNGQPAPAAGWFKALTWRAGSGLFATGVEWTPAARAMIEAGEYKFISPVFTYNAKGEVTRLLHAALTNDPALDGMAAVAAAFDLSALNPALNPDQEPYMNPESLKALGLAADATPEQIDAAVAALTTKITEADAKVAELTAQAATAAEQAAALKASHQPTAVVEELKTQLAALTAEHNQRQLDELIKTAVAEGRLVGAPQIEWARGQTPAALSSYLATTTPIAALTGTQTGGKAPDPAKPTLTTEELAACTLLGQSPDEYLAFKSNQSSAGAK